MPVRQVFRGVAFVAVLLIAALAASAPASSAGRPAGTDGGGGPAEYWTASRRAAAVPRDLVLDHRGLAYLKAPDGTLTPHGHGTPPEAAPLRAVPTGKPSGSGSGGGGGIEDTTPPSISDMVPAGVTIGYSQEFSATVTDEGSGVKSVTFQVRKGTAAWQSFSASSADGSVWTVGLQGFTDGDWSWQVVAKDFGTRGGNTATEGPESFTVDTGTGGDPGDGGGGDPTVVTNAEWSGGAVQTAAGRLYFEMPSNPKHTRWSGYVCSGTVATDGLGNGRSVIITAAHCVYDDVYKVFAQNVLFIPNQAETSGTGTDRVCSNDPLGCWEPSFGVVDQNWTTRTFPANIPWDYAYYVVNDTEVAKYSAGFAPKGNVLDAAAGSLAPKFDAAAAIGSRTHALGYSYSEDPNFMYCAENLETEPKYDDLWLGSCGLSGGSSGGPWVQPMDESGSGPIISVNSWGYSNQPGMGGPKLSGTSASCVFEAAKSQSFDVPDGGVVFAGTCSPAG